MNTYEEIIKRICEEGKQAYLVGGAVRDEFLGVDANDYDIVTDALPKELEELFPNRNVKTFGTSFLVTSIDGIEVATYRSDRNVSNGRQNCIVEACKTLNEDLSRRDFTFNSLALCPYTGEVIDPFDGMKDLNNKIVMFVGDPEKRILEDYLRMIRAARFACLIEGRLHPDTFQAICNNRVLVHEIAPERIRIELLKAMKYERPSIFFDVLFQTGILEIILPEFNKMYGHTGGQYHAETIAEHCLITGDSISSNYPLLRLVGYLHDVGKPATFDGENFIDHEKVGGDLVEDIFKRYKFSNDEITFATHLVRFHMRSLDYLITPKSVRRLLKSFSENQISWKDWIKLKIADKKANLAAKNYTPQEIKTFCLKLHKAKNESKSGGFKVTDLAVNGLDVMNLLNIKPGKQVGDILKQLLEIVIDDPSVNERDTLVSLILQRAQ